MATTQQQFKAQLIEQVQATHAAIEDRNHGAAIAAANLLAKLGKISIKLLIGSEELLSRESEEIKEELLRSVLVPSCFFLGLSLRWS